MVNFDNDASILAATSQEAVKGGYRLVMPGAHVPGGEPITSMASELNLDTAQQWCNYVRRTINEREESKNNPQGNRGGVPESGTAGAAPVSDVAGTSRPDDDEPVSETEEALVGALESRVQRLRSKVVELDDKAKSVELALSTARHDLRRAEYALARLREAFADLEEKEERFGGDE